ncbi:zinc finger protein 804B isoform X2 [Xenopus tropicalis]|uniref:Zinc finger protein 804B n=1 Tax=Xenopus tropicalis TaxID=8364 RepID=A0A803KCJ9_XENTR|nr:zinc finger protein 804B isoform X2 [Xenopus tropicalis]|eukprot:XP_012821074.1 PREDICTED: zinc finger protein 804B isoform X2 [Xenopus tropicalis]
MACYYLVISSTHLSNGHFRTIKGVFKGPLRKPGTSSLPGYAEKGKSIANALEDLKANFYCELCDKQYHKHKEFDNHINSYDHAHKQRLKELKQREFARNVASKSWKDEKKQEKALKRLHQLAELRKQQDCVSDKGPVCKEPRLRSTENAIFPSKDGRTSNSRCTFVCKGEPVSSSAIAENKEDILFGRDIMNKSRCCYVGNQTQLSFTNNSSVNNRTGVSFCFSKKALQKLDSSASVFNESTEDINDCSQFFNHKAKQMSVSFRHYAHLDDDAGENNTLTLHEKTDKSTPVHVPADEELFEDDDGGSKEQTVVQNEIAQSNLNIKPQSSDVSFNEACKQIENQNIFSRSEENCEISEDKDCTTKRSYQETPSNKHSDVDAVLIHHPSEDLSQKNNKNEVTCNLNVQYLDAPYDPELSCSSNVQYLDAPNQSAQSLNKCTEPIISEPLNGSVQTSAPSCLSVLSKDGSTTLQWPKELLLFTKSEPSISYACNPLYFDFKCSRKYTAGEASERISSTNEEQEDQKTAKEKQTDLESEPDSQPVKPKREKLISKDNLIKDSKLYSSYRAEKKITQKQMNDNVAQNSIDQSGTPNYVARKGQHSRKRKHSVQNWLGNCQDSVQRTDENNLVFRENSKSKNPKSSGDNLFSMIGKAEHMDWCSSYHKYKNIGIGQSENDSWDSTSDKNSSCSTVSSLENDTSPESSSQNSESKTIYEYSDSSMSVGSKHRHHRSSIIGKHNSDRSRERRKHHHSEGSDQEKVYKCRNVKHKLLKKVSRNQCQGDQLCYKHARQQQCPRKNDKNIKNSLCGRQAENKGCSNLSNSGEISEETTGSLSVQRCSQTGEMCNAIEKEKTTYKCYSQNIVSLSGKYCDRTSENIVNHIIVEEKKTLIAELILETGHSTKAEETKMTSAEFSEGGAMEIKEHSESFLAVEFPSAHETTILPLQENGTNDVLENGLLESKTDELNAYKVTVTTNDKNCVFENIIHMDTESRTPNIPNSIVEQPKQHGEVHPIMQSSDQRHFNVPCPLPSLRHLSENTSQMTKEEENKNGHIVNIKTNPVEENVKCFYDITMQDSFKAEKHQRVCHKTTSPPLTQQPITFSPDEVDKYRQLQLQAQQHMQKQRLSKHFKGLPSMGSSVFSAANTIQPVSVHHHPSITTIHHALMQRYAVTASMHPPPNHFPLPQLNPFPQPHFSPIALSSLTPTLFPAQPTFLASHPLHLVSATAIHPAPLTFQAIPHTALIPAIFTSHPNTGMSPAIHLPPLIHPFFQGQEFHPLSGTNQSH